MAAPSRLWQRQRLTFGCDGGPQRRSGAPGPGTAVGTVLILVFLPALYAIWFRARPDTQRAEERHAPLPAK